MGTHVKLQLINVRDWLSSKWISQNSVSRKLASEFELEQFRGFTGTYDLLNAVHNVRCWKSSSGNNDHEQVIIKQILGWGVNKSLRVL